MPSPPANSTRPLGKQSEGLLKYSDKLAQWLTALNTILPTERAPRTFPDHNTLTRRIVLIETVFEYIISLTNALDDAHPLAVPPSVFKLYEKRRDQYAQIILRLQHILDVANIPTFTAAETLEAAHARITDLKYALASDASASLPTPRATQVPKRQRGVVRSARVLRVQHAAARVGNLLPARPLDKDPLQVVASRPLDEDRLQVLASCAQAQLPAGPAGAQSLAGVASRSKAGGPTPRMLIAARAALPAVWTAFRATPYPDPHTAQGSSRYISQGSQGVRDSGPDMWPDVSQAWLNSTATYPSGAGGSDRIGVIRAGIIARITSAVALGPAPAGRGRLAATGGPSETIRAVLLLFFVKQEQSGPCPYCSCRYATSCTDPPAPYILRRAARKGPWLSVLLRALKSCGSVELAVHHSGPSPSPPKPKPSPKPGPEPGPGRVASRKYLHAPEQCCNATKLMGQAVPAEIPLPSAPLGALRSLRPRYLRDFIWSTGKRRISPTALATEIDPPLPDVPAEAFDNRELVHTVVHNPHLFKTSTPIRVARLEKLLETHPNRPLVTSFCKGLKNGFWPWARPVESHPVTLDGSMSVRSVDEQAFLEQTRDEEIAAGRFSEGFPELLPGMHAAPIHGVPKPHSEKLRLVTNFSAGEFSRNSIISRADTNQTHYDGIRELTDHLRALRREHGPDVELTVFKSDVKGAFKVLPMNVMWQPWQVYRIGTLFHVDRAATFGSSASPPIWTTFAGLVLWIAMVIFLIPNLFAYMDDFHSAQLATDMLYYKPYKRSFPTNKTRLLRLWDWLGIPHSEDKQIFGWQLVVIGFLVDTRLMRVTIPDSARAEFVAELRRWTLRPKRGVRRTLREWQALAGYANWVFNVFPLLKPALCNVYGKMENKSHPNAPIFVNESVRRDLDWLADHVERADGIFLIKSVDFDPDDANLVIYCDASTHGDGRGGMGFYIPALTVGYQSELPSGISEALKIFFYEALCVCAAIHRAAAILPHGSRLTVYTDSSNTVDIFSSLKALPAYNDILKSAVDVQLAHNIELRVLHVPGKFNAVADAISRWKNSAAIALVPGLTIHPFTAPDDALGPAKK
ncbi:hypothetical protein C8R46DRAFT_1044062 [Mycena filopes]|nr:hypothetical protein C8R46DRAFT_1044062 [Mycena filopes]